MGQTKESDQRVNFDELKGKSMPEIYRLLSKDPEKPIPPLLEEAAAVRPPPDDTPPPPDVSPDGTTGDKMPEVALPMPGSGPKLQSELGQQSAALNDWGDAAWFSSNFCSSEGMDSVWCLTHYSWASTGWRPTMFYQATGYNVGPSSVASYWIDEWWGYWQRIVTEDIYPGWWTSWWFEHSTWMRSAISGNDPDWHIHFVERFRNAAPGLTELYPPHPTEGDDHYWTEELQGITHNYSYWFLTNHWNVMRFPMTSNLNAYPDVYVGNPWPSMWDHLGAPAFGFNQGRVVVPMETDGALARRAAFGLFSTSLAAYGYRTIPTPPAGVPDDQATSCPWVAYNPVNGYYYSSAFDPNRIYVYYFDYLSNLVFVNAIQIRDGSGNPMQLHAIQGGTFSPSGKLYLSSDDQSDTDRGRIYLVDVNNGRVQGMWMTERHNTGSMAEEMEGITYWDSNGSAPGVQGQLHLVLLDQSFWADDDWYFKHFAFSGPP